LGKDIIGHGFEKYLALLLTIFLFVLLGNLEGIVPGLGSPTGYISGNMAIGLIVFVLYNVAGIKEHGAGYIKQFAGPFLWLAPMFLLIELISHIARPVSLAMRLLINVFADHMILDIFTGLTYLGFPVALAFFGLLVAFVQSFVFTLLTSIYISMAVSHDH
jgi:F-type H+-transporting ATPase subunit a